MTNVDVLGSRGNGIRFSDSTSTLIVAKDRERLRAREIEDREEKFDPNSFLYGVR